MLQGVTARTTPSMRPDGTPWHRAKPLIACLGLLVAALLFPSTAGAVTIRAAGDVACLAPYTVTATSCRHGEVASLLAPADRVIALGDLQYDVGTLDEFLGSYDPTWGVYKAKTWPTPGNHEYGTANAAGYRAYWGLAPDAPTWYSYDIGSWHVVGLDSECAQVGGCGPGSPQGQWLAADLKANIKPCLLAFWHKPRWSSVPGGGNRTVAPFWTVLYQYRADVVLNGHAHNYERFAKKLPGGAVNASGIREFVVGTGGHGLHPFSAPVAGSQKRGMAFGVLNLDLRASRYSWRFLAESGSFTDTGSTACH